LDEDGSDAEEDILVLVLLRCDDDEADDAILPIPPPADDDDEAPAAALRFAAWTRLVRSEISLLVLLLFDILPLSAPW
jgi:hypothetical protein